MRFGPLELQACGENNFTMKALGALAFSRPLRQRFVRLLLGEGAVEDDDDITILFFSRIGEGFLREAIERERRDGVGDLEARFNAAAGLPSDLRWMRRKGGKLVQPAKWQKEHIEEMLVAHGSSLDNALRASLGDFQNYLNTEPDLVLQWRDRLLLVEIKVLSGEGADQTGRQRRLGAFLGRLLGWRCDLCYLGPAHGKPPIDSQCRSVSWAEVADSFDNVPEIAGYIREFRFFYRGAWRSMVSRQAAPLGGTAFDLMSSHAALLANSSPGAASPGFVPSSVKIPANLAFPPVPAHDIAPVRHADPWHFTHLEVGYFLPIALAHRNSRLPPMVAVWTGCTGVAYDQKALGRRVKPNWMVEVEGGMIYAFNKRRGFSVAGPDETTNMRRWTWQKVTDHFAALA